jgi:hypothetical protein
MKATLRRTRRPVLPLLALGSALLLLVTACGGSGGSSTAKGPYHHYVALGDSYSSGPGLDPVADAGCSRSGANYPSLVARAEGITDFTDVTCSGATTANLTSAQKRSGAAVNDPQFDALNAQTDLVTIGMGLNNADISIQVMYLCLPQLNQAKACASYLALPDTSIVKELDALGVVVQAELAAIRSHAPHARIVLVGYPRILPDQGDCPTVMPLTGAAADRMRLVFRTTDEVYRRIAAQAKVDYISTWQASQGHDLCSSSPWTNGITDRSASGQGAATHPRPPYMQAVAQLVESDLQHDPK